MPGFMSGSTAMIICKSGIRKALTVEDLHKGAFSDAIDPEGIKSGWVGLNDLLDRNNFFLATSDARFSGFSFRMDSRKPPSSVVRLRLAEAIKAEEMMGKKVGATRKREMREEIADRLTAELPFAPVLVDCIWDGEKGRLFVATASEKMLVRILATFRGCFGMDVTPIAAEREMAAVFSTIQNEGSLKAAGYTLTPAGSASLLSAPASEQKCAIAVRNSQDGVSDALNQGLDINRMGLEAYASADEENVLKFTLDTSLVIAGLKLPKAEKGAEEEATFLINAEVCAQVADIVEDLAGIAE